MAMPILLYAVTAALYGLLALYFWRTRWCKAAQADTTQTDTTTKH